MINTRDKSFRNYIRRKIAWFTVACLFFTVCNFSGVTYGSEGVSGNESAGTRDVVEPGEEGERPEGVETFIVRTVPDNVRSFVVKTSPDENFRPEGVESFLVETTPDDDFPASDSDLKEDDSDIVDPESDLSEEDLDITTSENESYSGDDTVADAAGTSDNEVTEDKSEIEEDAVSFNGTSPAYDTVSTDVTVSVNDTGSIDCTVSADSTLSGNDAEDPEDSLSENDVVSDNDVSSEDHSVSEDDIITGSEEDSVSQDAVSGDSVSVDTISRNTLSVGLPVTRDGESCYDFILDPQGMIRKTDGARYGGKSFKEGVYIFFKNAEHVTDNSGEKGSSVSENISYSDESDVKSIENRGDIPIKVNIRAEFKQTVSGNNEVLISGDPLFEEIKKPALAFAIVDGDGKESYMDWDGVAEIERILYPSADAKDDGKDTNGNNKTDKLTFMIRGDVNTDADWNDVKGDYSLNVSWSAEAYEDDTDDVDPLLNKDGKDHEKTVYIGREKGKGIIEGSYDRSINSIVLPVCRDDQYKFRMDPQRLIESTGGAAYPGKTFEKGQTLFFRNLDSDSGYDYSSVSDRGTIINRGTEPVKVSVSVSLVDEEGISLSHEKDFLGYPDSQIFLSIVSGNGEIPEDIRYTDKGVYFETVLPAVDESYYELIWDEDKGYVYELVSDNGISGQPEYPEFDFRLTGSTNENAGWKKLSHEELTVEVVWKVESMGDK